MIAKSTTKQPLRNRRKVKVERSNLPVRAIQDKNERRTARIERSASNDDSDVSITII